MGLMTTGAVIGAAIVFCVLFSKLLLLFDVFFILLHLLFVDFLLLFGRFAVVVAAGCRRRWRRGRRHHLPIAVANVSHQTLWSQNDFISYFGGNGSGGE